MAKKLIRLTEQDLHRIVESSVDRIINENMEDEGLFDYFRSMGRQGGQKAQQAGAAMGQKMRQGYDSVKGAAQKGYNAAVNKVGQGYDSVRNAAQQGYNAAANKVGQAVQGVKDMHHQAMQDSMVANMNSAIANFENSLQTFIKNGGNFQNAQLSSRLSGIKNMLNQYAQH